MNEDSPTDDPEGQDETPQQSDSVLDGSEAADASGAAAGAEPEGEAEAETSEEGEAVDDVRDWLADDQEDDTQSGASSSESGETSEPTDSAVAASGDSQSSGAADESQDPALSDDQSPEAGAESSDPESQEESESTESAESSESDTDPSAEEAESQDEPGEASVEEDVRAFIRQDEPDSPEESEERPDGDEAESSEAAESAQQDPEAGSVADPQSTDQAEESTDHEAEDDAGEPAPESREDASSDTREETDASESEEQFQSSDESDSAVTESPDADEAKAQDSETTSESDTSPDEESAEADSQPAEASETPSDETSTDVASSVAEEASEEDGQTSAEEQESADQEASDVDPAEQDASMNEESEDSESSETGETADESDSAASPESEETAEEETTGQALDEDSVEAEDFPADEEPADSESDATSTDEGVAAVSPEAEEISEEDEQTSQVERESAEQAPSDEESAAEEEDGRSDDEAADTGDDRQPEDAAVTSPSEEPEAPTAERSAEESEDTAQPGEPAADEAPRAASGDAAAGGTGQPAVAEENSESVVPAPQDESPSDTAAEHPSEQDSVIQPDALSPDAPADEPTAPGAAPSPPDDSPPDTPGAGQAPQSTDPSEGSPLAEAREQLSEADRQIASASQPVSPDDVSGHAEMAAAAEEARQTADRAQTALTSAVRQNAPDLAMADTQRVADRAERSLAGATQGARSGDIASAVGSIQALSNAERAAKSAGNILESMAHGDAAAQVSSTAEEAQQNVQGARDRIDAILADRSDEELAEQTKGAQDFAAASRRAEDVQDTLESLLAGRVGEVVNGLVQGVESLASAQAPMSRATDTLSSLAASGGGGNQIADAQAALAEAREHLEAATQGMSRDDFETAAKAAQQIPEANSEVERAKNAVGELTSPDVAEAVQRALEPANLVSDALGQADQARAALKEALEGLDTTALGQAQETLGDLSGIVSALAESESTLSALASGEASTLLESANRSVDSLSTLEELLSRGKEGLDALRESDWSELLGLAASAAEGLGSIRDLLEQILEWIEGMQATGATQDVAADVQSGYARVRSMVGDLGEMDAVTALEEAAGLVSPLEDAMTTMEDGFSQIESLAGDDVATGMEGARGIADQLAGLPDTLGSGKEILDGFLKEGQTSELFEQASEVVSSAREVLDQVQHVGDVLDRIEGGDLGGLLEEGFALADQLLQLQEPLAMIQEKMASFSSGGGAALLGPVFDQAESLVSQARQLFESTLQDQIADNLEPARAALDRLSEASSLLDQVSAQLGAIQDGPADALLSAVQMSEELQRVSDSIGQFSEHLSSLGGTFSETCEKGLAAVEPFGEALRVLGPDGAREGIRTLLSQDLGVVIDRAIRGANAFLEAGSLLVRAQEQASILQNEIGVGDPTEHSLEILAQLTRDLLGLVEDVPAPEEVTTIRDGLGESPRLSEVAGLVDTVSDGIRSFLAGNLGADGSSPFASAQSAIDGLPELQEQMESSLGLLGDFVGGEQAALSQSVLQQITGLRESTDLTGKAQSILQAFMDADPAALLREALDAAGVMSGVQDLLDQAQALLVAGLQGFLPEDVLAALLGIEQLPEMIEKLGLARDALEALASGDIDGALALASEIPGIQALVAGAQSALMAFAADSPVVQQALAAAEAVDSAQAAIDGLEQQLSDLQESLIPSTNGTAAPPASDLPGLLDEGPYDQMDYLTLTTPLGDDLEIVGFRGEEKISEPFRFTLDLESESADIEFSDIVGEDVTVSLHFPEGSERHINGLVTRFVQAGRGEEDVVNYQAEITAWVWMLTLTSDSRIFQEKSVPDIIEEIFGDLGFTDYKNSLQKTYETRDYCVQYGESSFDFISRLMEDEGIFYFFEHGESSHTLILADDADAHEVCAGPSPVRYEAPIANSVQLNVVKECTLEERVVTSNYALSDFNFETPETDLKVSVSGGDGDSEEFEFPGGYSETEVGEARATVRIEEKELPARWMSGGSYCMGFAAGGKFTLEEHYRLDVNASYVLYSVRHEGQKEEYENTFEAFPAETPFRPGRKVAKPVIHGAQTAIVVGKEGEEIWTDNYGRIKVQFHWDRQGEMDENSSCWIRVAQGWAGKQWGAMFLPRIGQEVLVSFMDGDPDRPLVTGSVYNSTQTVPYDLPDEQTKSTIKSNSSKEGEGFNEIRFDDLKENEEIYVHAQKDLSLKVLNNEVADVKNARYAFVKQGEDEEPEIDEGVQDMLVVVGNRKIEVKGEESEETHTNEGKYVQEVTKTREVTVQDNETHTNEKDFTQAVNGNYDLTVDGDLTQTVKGKYTLKVDGDLIIDVSGKVSIKAGQDLLAEASGSLTNKAGMDLTNDAGKNLNNTAGMDLTNEGGMNLTNKASMDVTNDGLNVNNSAKVALNNKAVTLKNEASAMMENTASAMLKLEGSAMVMVSGGLVKIN